MIKKLIKYFLILIILLLLTSPFWVKFLPKKYLSSVISKSPVVDKYLCNFSTKINGQSMAPLIPSGTSVTSSRCFEADDLKEGTVVLFYDDSDLRFGIIRHILFLDPVVFKISDEKAPELFHDVIREEIVGIVRDIDVSNSKYRAKQETESFILSSGDFLSDFYLAKIPKGMGLETATVEKTNVFDRQQDKFCFVILPKKNLVGIDSEIINKETQAITSLGKDVVFSADTKPNTNCLDFGSGPGAINLKKGSYNYRLFLNHQILKNIQFEVR